MIERQEYVITQLSPLHADISELLDGAYDEEIIRRCRIVVDTESPITEDLMLKRVMNSLGIGKMGIRIREHLRGLIPYILLTKETISDQVIYHTEREENFYRPQVNGEEKYRYSYQIPYTEAMLAVEAIYQDDDDTSHGILKKDLRERFIRKLGYTKRGSSLDALFETVFHILKENNVLLKNSSGKFVFH